MPVGLVSVVTVLLPGTGSDEDYLRRAFAAPLERAGAVVVAVPPQPEQLVAGYLRALDKAALDGPIAVGGVSIGAAVATCWALANPGRTVAVLAALPPWTGVPGAAPAALSARHTAARLRREGLAATTAAMTSSSPPWLAEELARSWLRQWPNLPDAMDQAAAYVGPTATELGRLAAPMAVVGASDDPIHPITVACEWASAVPHAALSIVTLDQVGPQPAVIGAAALAALQAIN